jgi:DNA polymerase elongation subunit (family B)
LQDEVTMIQGYVTAVHTLDPDIIVGWDVQKASLGYLVERWVE